jgi:hypothetical protein
LAKQCLALLDPLLATRSWDRQRVYAEEIFKLLSSSENDLRANPIFAIIDWMASTNIFLTIRWLEKGVEGIPKADSDLNAALLMNKFSVTPEALQFRLGLYDAWSRDGGSHARELMDPYSHAPESLAAKSPVPGRLAPTSSLPALQPTLQVTRVLPPSGAPIGGENPTKPEPTAMTKPVLARTTPEPPAPAAPPRPRGRAIKIPPSGGTPRTAPISAAPTATPSTPIGELGLSALSTQPVLQATRVLPPGRVAIVAASAVPAPNENHVRVLAIQAAMRVPSLANFARTYSSFWHSPDNGILAKLVTSLAQFTVPIEDCRTENMDAHLKLLELAVKDLAARDPALAQKTLAGLVGEKMTRVPPKILTRLQELANTR